MFNVLRWKDVSALSRTTGLFCVSLILIDIQATLRLHVFTSSQCETNKTQTLGLFQSLD